MEMKIEDFGLVHPIYPRGTMKFSGMSLNSAKVLKICPLCLKPGNMQQYYGPFVVGIWRMTIPISTHRECSQGFRKKNISGSARVWAESGNICFSFSNPVYSMLFSRINFGLLHDGRGRPLTSLYEEELQRLKREQESRKKKKGTCPRCKNDLYTDHSECPSCGLSRKEKWFRVVPGERDKSVTIDDDIIIKCPECEIVMLKEAKLKKCGNCGSPLTKKKTTPQKEDSE